MIIFVLCWVAGVRVRVGVSYFDTIHLPLFQPYAQQNVLYIANLFNWIVFASNNNRNNNNAWCHSSIQCWERLWKNAERKWSGCSRDDGDEWGQTERKLNVIQCFDCVSFKCNKRAEHCNEGITEKLSHRQKCVYTQRTHIRYMGSVRHPPCRR